MADAFFDTAWGPIRLYCSELRTTGGRSIVTHKPSSGNVYETQDRGREQQNTEADLLFDQMEGETLSGLERFRIFERAVELGETHVFTHPMKGSYRAKVGRFDHVLKDGSITASVEFVPEGRIPAVTIASRGTSVIAGADAIAGAANQVQLELQRVGMVSAVLDVARAAADAWQDVNVTARRVLVDVGQLQDSIRDEIDQLGLGDSLALWQAYRSMLLLADAVVNTGRLATAELERIITVRTGREISLRALLASIFGARDVDHYYELTLSLNDIRTPGWVPIGTLLRLPAPTLQPRFN
jgi:hypothetical protein